MEAVSRNWRAGTGHRLTAAARPLTPPLRVTSRGAARFDAVLEAAANSLPPHGEVSSAPLSQILGGSSVLANF